jgi:hypothetical protein
MARVGIAAGWLLAVGAAFPQVALMHGIVGKADLPIPVWLLSWAATIAFVVCFIAARPKSALSQNSPRRSALRGHLRALGAPESRLDKPNTGVSGALQSRLHRFDSGRRLLSPGSSEAKLHP